MLPEHAENPCACLFVDQISGPVKAELRKDVDTHIPAEDLPTFTINVSENSNLTEPVLVTSFSQACSIFGKQTFDKSWSLFDKQTFYVLQQLRHGPCYIVVKNCPSKFNDKEKKQMKEKLKEFILQKLGGKLPDDPCQDMIKVCGIKVFSVDSFDKEFQIIDKYDANSLSVGVFYSDHEQNVMLSILGNLADGHGNRFCMRSVPLRNCKLDDGIESLVKLMRDGVIQLTGYPASEHPQFSDEDKVDHRTVALLATCDKKWLLSINLKHRILTLPIGKVHPNESPWHGLCREMWEELGFKLQDIFRGCPPGATALKTKFKKVYDFDGIPVNVETSVYHIDSDECYSNGIWLQAENREPEKCGGLMWVNRDDIRRIAESTGLMLADCVDAALNADMVHV